MADDPDTSLTLADQFRLLAKTIPEDEAKARLGRLFRLKGQTIYSPKYAVSYEDAVIDFVTGRVTLRRLARQPFTPMLKAAEHYELFPETGPEYLREVRRRRWIEHFGERQRNVREWIRLDEIAEWCARSVTGVNAAAEEEARTLAYQRLDQSARRGEFEALCRGRRQSTVLYLHPRRTRHGENRRWLTREALAYVQNIRSLATYCWLPWELARRWFAVHGYPWASHFDPAPDAARLEALVPATAAAADGGAKGSAEGPSQGQRGRKAGSGSKDDEQKLRQMLQLLAKNDVPSVHAAAKFVARQIAPKHSQEAEIARLRRKFRVRWSTNPPTGETWAKVLADVERELNRK